MTYQRPKPDPRDDAKFAAIGRWLKARGAKGHIRRDGSVDLHYRHVAIRL